MAKDSFIIYKSFYEPIKSLSDKQLGRLFRALFTYQIEGSTNVEQDIQMAFAFFKNQMEIDQSKYQKVVERNRQNGSKGGRPTKEENPKNPAGLKKPKKPDNGNGNGNGKLKKNTKEKFDLSFVDIAFLSIVKDFIQYRKSDLKKPFKTIRGVKRFYNELLKLSSSNAQKAAKLIEYAKDKEWRTVYEVKEYNKSDNHFKNSDVDVYDEKI